jgi:hypothetical protein
VKYRENKIAISKKPVMILCFFSEISLRALLSELTVKPDKKTRYLTIVINEQSTVNNQSAVKNQS